MAAMIAKAEGLLLRAIPNKRAAKGSDANGLVTLAKLATESRDVIRPFSTPSRKAFVTSTPRIG